MNSSVYRLCVIVIMGAAVLSSCMKYSRKSMPVQEATTVPQYRAYFEKGKEARASGDLKAATEAFQKCLELNPEYIPGLEALAFTSLDGGEYDNALHYFSEVLKYNAYSKKSRFGLGRVYLLQGDYQQAVEAFNMVLTTNPDDAETWFYRGIALRENGEDYLSTTSLIRAVINDESYRSTVAGIIHLTDPVTSNLFKAEYLAIESKTSITRGEMAALLVAIVRDNRVYEPADGGRAFQTPGQFEKPRGKISIPDVPGNYWAKNEIYRSVAAGLVELYPEGTFKPFLRLTKAECATILQTALVRLLNDSDLATRYFAGQSPFQDMNSSHWAYNAARVVTEYSLLPPRQPDIFGLDDDVPGTTAVRALERLKEYY